MARPLLYYCLFAAGACLSCSSASSVGGADATYDAKDAASQATTKKEGGNGDSGRKDGGHKEAGHKEAGHKEAGVVHVEGGILDGTIWEATVPDVLLSVSDALADVPTVLDPNNCVPPGTPSNAVGVGGYCSSAGGQCNHVAPDAAPSICTADFGAPAHLGFCTVACTSTPECGPGSATCQPAAGGTLCVPAACAAFIADAGTDARVDARHPRDGGDAASGDARADRDAP